MTVTRGLIVLVVVAGLLMVPATATLDGGADTNESTEDDPALSDEVSTFMQANTANAAQNVDDGMFDAAYEAADAEERERLIDQRTANHEMALESLSNESAALENGAGNFDDAEYEARKSRLAADLGATDSSMNVTAQRATAENVDAETIQELRAEAADLAGPDVAERAQQMQGIDPPQGPPDHAGGPMNDSDEHPGAADTGPPGENTTKEDDTAGHDDDTDEKDRRGSGNTGDT